MISNQVIGQRCHTRRKGRVFYRCLVSIGRNIYKSCQIQAVRNINTASWEFILTMPPQEAQTGGWASDA